MVCPHCGAEQAPDAVFCNRCGQNLASEPYPYAENPYQTFDVSPNNILVWGILAASFGVSFVLSFLGIIFGAITLGKANRFIADYGPISGKVKTGHILSKVGIIAGSILTALFLLYIAMVVGAIATH